MSEDYKPDGEIRRKLFSGSENQIEVTQSKTDLASRDVDIAAMLAPSEVEYKICFRGYFLGQTWKVGSAEYGDVIGGTWGIYVRGTDLYASLGATHHGGVRISKTAFQGKMARIFERPETGRYFHGSSRILRGGELPPKGQMEMTG